MVEHPTTSIVIYSDIQYDDSTLSSRTESIKSTVVTPQKIYKSVLPSGNTTPLQNKPKISSNKKDNPKTNKITQDIEADIQQAKNKK